MRVSTVWMQQQSLNTMLDRQSNIATLNQQLSTGKRITQPSDDPVGAARALDLGHQIADTAQYQRNITAANARLSLEDQSLGSVTNVLQRVRTLVLQAVNGSQSDGTRGDIAAELVQLRQQLLGQANSQDSQGEYIYAGNRTGTAPFATQGNTTYFGDDGQRMVAAGAGLQIATGDPGSAVFANIPTGNGTFAISAGAANAGTVVAGATSVSDPAASPSAWDGGGYSIVFTAANAYAVRDASNTVVDTGSYDPVNGGTIGFRGAQIALTGTPVVGDSLTIAPSTNQDVFTTLQNFIGALQLPNGGGADMQNAMNAQLMNLDQAMGNVTRTRGQVGARMNALDQQQGLNNDLTLQYQSSLSDVQDVNYYDAVGQLNAQTTALQAAQLTFSKMQTSKLFDYLR